MKGFTKVSRHDVQKAVLNWRTLYDAGNTLRVLGTERYYEKHYTNGSSLTKWLNKGKTPQEFVSSKLGMFGIWSNILHEVLSQEDLDLLDMWQWDKHKSEYIACKALLNASSDHPRLGSDLCFFVNKYANMEMPA